MYESTLRIAHKSLYADITARTDVYIEMWCNHYCDLVYLSGSDITAPLETFDETIGIRESVTREDEAILITTECLREDHNNLLEGYLRPHQCISLPPLTYSDGALYARVLALSEDQLSGVFHDIRNDHNVTVENKRELESIAPNIPILMPGSALPTLSDGQQRALSLAVDEGYYEIPRGATTGGIAEQMGVSRRTFEEHLRRAENKIIKNMMQYLINGRQ